MLTLSSNSQTPQEKRQKQLNQKMLGLAQELLIEELVDGTILACGAGFTNRLSGRFGQYETFEGEVIAFQPQFNLNFTLICEEFIVTSSLTMIKAIIHQLDDYELAIGD
jgi:hypothetical protein